MLQALRALVSAKSSTGEEFESRSWAPFDGGVAVVLFGPSQVIKIEWRFASVVRRCPITAVERTRGWLYHGDRSRWRAAVKFTGSSSGVRVQGSRTLGFACTSAVFVPVVPFAELQCPLSNCRFGAVDDWTQKSGTFQIPSKDDRLSFAYRNQPQRWYSRPTDCASWPLLSLECLHGGNSTPLTQHNKLDFFATTSFPRHPRLRAAWRGFRKRLPFGWRQ